MRTLPILWRMAEDLRRLAMPSSPLFDYPWITNYRWVPPAASQLNHVMDMNFDKIGKHGYQVSMNVSEFKPEQLTVKVIDNSVIVEGKSEENDNNNGYVSRHFIRRFSLPQGYVADNAISTLSSDGVLTVNVPKPPEIEEKAREIPIQRTGSPTEKAQESEQAKRDSEKKRPPHSAFFAVSLTTIPSMGSVAALPATAADVAALSNATSSTTLTSADATCVCVSAVSISISPSRAASAISVEFDTTLGSISATKPLSLECNVNTAIVEVEMMLFFTTIVFVELALVSSPAIVSAVTVLVEFPAALSTPFVTIEPFFHINKMSSLPLILSLADDLNRLSMAASPFYDPSLYYARHPLALLTGEQQQQLRNRDLFNADQVSTIGKDGFQVCMDVQQFKPNELVVKVADNCIIVEGKHEEREDDRGFISRHFVRRYALPKGYDPNKVLSTLSSDGVLTVNVPKPAIEDKPNERVIQIQQVGPAHLNVKENPKEINEESAEKDSKQSKL
ncbi:uncharacterized protein ACN427_003347 [Glossina fuscipes fuscipes]